MTAQFSNVRIAHSGRSVEVRHFKTADRSLAVALSAPVFEPTIPTQGFNSLLPTNQN
jgi:hypothetical protein